MASSGIRIGAWDYLQRKHVTPLVDVDGHVTAARLLVYAGDTEEDVPDNSLLILASTPFICSLVSWYPS
jgi:hypothetical protein